MPAIERYLPAPWLRPYIQSFNFAEISTEEASQKKTAFKVLPTPYCSIILFFSKPSFKIMDKGKTRLDEFSLTGLYTHPKQYEPDKIIRQMIICFTAIGIQHLLSFSLKEITDGHAPIQQVFPSDYNRLINQLNEAPDNNKRVQITEAFFYHRLSQLKPLDSRILSLSNYIFKTKGAKKLKTLSKETFLGERTVQRLIQQYVGVNYKQFTKLVRFQYAKMLISRQDESLTEIGLKAGYFDQAHFIHDFQGFCGLSPGKYREKHGRFLWNEVDGKNPETTKVMNSS